MYIYTERKEVFANAKHLFDLFRTRFVRTPNVFGTGGKLTSHLSMLRIINFCTVFPLE